MTSAALDKRYIQMSAGGGNGGSRLRSSQTGKTTLHHQNQYQAKGNQALSYNPELIRWLNKRKPKKSSHTSSLNSSGVKKENRNGPLKASCCNEPSPFLSL